MIFVQSYADHLSSISCGDRKLSSLAVFSDGASRGRDVGDFRSAKAKGRRNRAGGALQFHVEMALDARRW